MKYLSGTRESVDLWTTVCIHSTYHSQSAHDTAVSSHSIGTVKDLSDTVRVVGAVRYTLDRVSVSKRNAFRDSKSFKPTQECVEARSAATENTWSIGLGV
jgi:hypothetical protein